MKLPLNCAVEYFADFLTEEEAVELYRFLVDDYSLDKSRRTIEAGGRMIETDSFKFFFSTADLIARDTHPEYIHGKSHEWTGPMATLRERVESLTGQKFELAMCLYYPDGGFFAPYHFDQETSGKDTILPSISLGEVREFAFRENSTGEIYSLDLANGSLLVMGEYCQSRYEHSLPKDPKYLAPRINITFREAAFQ